MKQAGFVDPISKVVMRKLWRIFLYGHGLVTPLLYRRKSNPRVFYGGARSGDIGGPLVKVKRLQKYYPEHRVTYNLVYLLSNTPYLLKITLNRLQKKNIPIVLNQNGVFYPGWYQGAWEENNAIMAKAYHAADFVFWQSEFCRYAADKFLGRRIGIGKVLYNAVDTQQFCPAISGHKSGSFMFLMTGKIGKHLTYRLESTIAGLSFARKAGLDCALRIDGWIEDINGVTKLAMLYEVEKHVIIGKRYSQEQAPSVYQNADAYVMTKYLDPCPNTVIEAMACGLPILYSNSGGVPELVGPDAGVGLDLPEDWLNVHVPSAEAIAIGMGKIIDDCQSMGTAARLRACTLFDIQDWLTQHQLIFEQLLCKRI